MSRDADPFAIEKFKLANPSNSGPRPRDGRGCREAEFVLNQRVEESRLKTLVVRLLAPRNVFDRHRAARSLLIAGTWSIQPWLLNAGLREQAIKERPVPFGRGFKDMPPACAIWKALCWKRCAHGGRPEQMPSSSVTLPATESFLENVRRAASTVIATALGVAPLRTAPRFDVKALIGRSASGRHWFQTWFSIVIVSHIAARLYHY